MREQVCIVLNERESTKAKAAETLSLRLKESGITSSRIPITENIGSVLKQRLPKIIILDYLLGDYSTGLDIQSGLHDLEESERPKILFLTDEPSIQVAVTALRQGALHYVEFDDPLSINKVVDEVRSQIALETSAPVAPRGLPDLDDLIFGSPAGLLLKKRIQEIATKRAPITFVHGAPGSGVTTAAQALRALLQDSTHFRGVDLKYFEGDLLAVAGLVPRRESLCLGGTLSLLIENADEDEGDFFSKIAEEHARLWSHEEQENCSNLILCSNDEATLTAWKRAIPGIEILSVPSLATRKEDSAGFVQRFIREAEEFMHKKVKPFSPEVVTWLGSLAWKGELREFRSVIIDSAIASVSESGDIKSIIETRRELWNELHAEGNTGTPDLSPLAAATMLEMCGFRYQAAAARLGCSRKDLYNLVHAGKK